MKTVQFTEFRRQASQFLDEVELGETLIVMRHGRPVAEISPMRVAGAAAPSWKREPLRLGRSGASLSAAILAEREEGA